MNVVRFRQLASDLDRVRESGVAGYVEVLCDRIDEVDPEVRAFVEEPGRRERLGAEARALEPWTDRPLLFGAAVAVKDIIHVDGLPTRAGSQLPPEVLAGPEAAVIRRLRELGALVLGKTVTAELASMAPGPTRNPHNLGHTPGGSSSGSAAAVAAGMAAYALGTQTLGSVIRPAAYCGIVGFKPTFDRIPTDGVIPNSPTFDTVGLFTADVAGMSLLAPALCTNWTSYAASPQPTLGIPIGPYLDQTDAPALAAFAQHVDRLRSAGYDVREVPALSDIDAVNERHRIISRFEMADTHRTWFAEYGDRYHPITAAAIREGQSIAPADYDRARSEREPFTDHLVATMDTTGIDAWIAPSATGPAPAGLTTTGNPAMNIPWTQAHMPTLTLPADTQAGLPLGLQFASRPTTDEHLLTWAPTLESTLTD